MVLVSIFRTFDTVAEEVELADILMLIQTGTYKDEVTEIRSLLLKGENEKASTLKKKLPAFTPTGLFNKVRNSSKIKEYSGVIVLNIDKLSPDNIPKVKADIISIPYTYSCFISPGNRGFKILVKVDNNSYYHKLAYNEIKVYYETNIQQIIDKSGSDISRLCFFSYDPDIYINTGCETFKTKINMIEENIKKVVEQIEEKQIDITSAYKDWVSIGFALVDGLGEGGSEYFHRVSCIYSDYNYEQCDTQFKKCLKANGKGITVSSFFHFAKENGIDISVPESLLEKPCKISEAEKVLMIDKIQEFLNAGYGFRYNIVSGIIEYRLSDSDNWMHLDDYTENSIYCALQKQNIKCSLALIRSILFSDFCSPYDPFETYFKMLPGWDKDNDKDYILQLSRSVITTNDLLWHNFFKKWLVASVASLIDKTVVNHTVLIFSGAQGIGKTTWMEKLTPPALKEYLFSGTINPNNKDTLIHMAECMFINMDELENMNRTEIGTFKEIITKSSIRMRRPYGHNQVSLPRRASFMGSVNSLQFLIDPSGSRRFLCFEVNSIDYKHNIDLNMVYSQAFALYKQGYKFYFDGEEINAIIQNNDQYQLRTVEEELLMTYFKVPDENTFNVKYLTASAVVVRLSEKARLNITNGTAIIMGKCLKKNDFQRTKKNGLYVWAIEEIGSESIE